MQICVECGRQFPTHVIVEGVRLDLWGRKRCLDCHPHRPLRHPRKPVPHTVKQLICLACGREFPAKMVIDGKVRSLYRRSFCLECSPFGEHNTSKFPLGLRFSEEGQKARKERRREQFRRSLWKRRRARKRQLVAEFGGRCMDCGYSACFEVLQFHHRDPKTKDFRLGKFNGSLARLRAEAAKCDLVCANCHRMRHAREASVSRHRVVELRRETKRRAIAALGGRCVSCEREMSAPAFEFHHLDAAEKTFALSADGIYRSWDKVSAELDKCVLLCANCHAETHAGFRILPERRLATTIPA